MIYDHTWGVVGGADATFVVICDPHLSGISSPRTTQHSCNSGITYPDLHDPTWITSPPHDRGADFKLDSKTSRMIAEDAWGVVDGEAVTLGVIHTRETCYMHP